MNDPTTPPDDDRYGPHTPLAPREYEHDTTRDTSRDPSLADLGLEEYGAQGEPMTHTPPPKPPTFKTIDRRSEDAPKPPPLKLPAVPARPLPSDFIAELEKGNVCPMNGAIVLYAVLPSDGTAFANPMGQGRHAMFYIVKAVADDVPDDADVRVGDKVYPVTSCIEPCDPGDAASRWFFASWMDLRAVIGRKPTRNIKTKAFAYPLRMEQADDGGIYVLDGNSKVVDGPTTLKEAMLLVEKGNADSAHRRPLQASVIDQGVDLVFEQTPEEPWMPDAEEQDPDADKPHCLYIIGDPVPKRSFPTKQAALDFGATVKKEIAWTLGLVGGPLPFAYNPPPPRQPSPPLPDSNGVTQPSQWGLPGRVQPRPPPARAAGRGPTQGAIRGK